MPPPVPLPELLLELLLELALPLAAPVAAPLAALPLEVALLDAVPLAFVDVVVSAVPFLPDAAPCCPVTAASATFSMRIPPPVPLPELLPELLPLALLALALLEALPFADAFASLVPLVLFARLFCALISTAARSMRVPPPVPLALLADEAADASVALADDSDAVPVSIR